MLGRMFDRELPPAPSILGFAAQQLGIPISALILTLLIGSRFGDVGSLVICPLAFFAIGGAARRRFPAYAGAGRWIWVLPFSFCLCGFFDDWARQSLRETLAEFFWPEQNGEVGLLILLATIPTSCCCLYSAGIALSMRRIGPPNSPPPGPDPL
jgi:hypothetical protein